MNEKRLTHILEDTLSELNQSACKQYNWDDLIMITRQLLTNKEFVRRVVNEYHNWAYEMVHEDPNLQYGVGKWFENIFEAESKQ